MKPFEPRNPEFRARIEREFGEQPFINRLGGVLARAEPGQVDIHLPCRTENLQQSGYVHGGALTSIADTAAAFAAMSLASADVSILTTELKVNFLRPAGRGLLVAVGNVIKPGRTLNICEADIYELSETEAPSRPGAPVDLEASRHAHVLTGLFTIMFMSTHAR